MTRLIELGVLPVNAVLITGLQILAALILDRILGETSCWHPLVGFGKLANKLEYQFNKHSAKDQPIHIKLVGCVCCIVLVLPLPLISYFAESHSLSYLVFETFLLYLALGQKSLSQHAMQIFTPLSFGNLNQARHFTSHIVSRDTTQLSEAEISRATVESVLENGHDAVIASLFYFVIGGAPLVILHRLINTLDAMWGYKTPQFLQFGWCAAKLDDLLGFFSAICTSILYLVIGGQLFYSSAKLAWQQSNQYKSKNGGLTMSCGAQTLQISLGGFAYYQGTKTHGVTLGKGRKSESTDIPLSIKLVNQSAYTLVTLILVLGTFIQVFQ